jgi:hypothetical protein
VFTVLPTAWAAVATMTPGVYGIVHCLGCRGPDEAWWLRYCPLVRAAVAMMRPVVYGSAYCLACRGRDEGSCHGVAHYMGCRGDDAAWCLRYCPPLGLLPWPP